MPLAPGTRLGPYEVLASLGVGGMGEVYRARDARLGRDVAVKVMPPQVADNPAALERFEREVHAVAALSHPNILTLHDFGRQESPTGAGQAITYAVMELLEGETLRERLATGALPPRKSVDIAAQVARGLAAAHDKHIAHRDLKPENIFIVADGSVKILDFGLARNTARPQESPSADSPTVAADTEPGTVLGTVGYMAPEQVRGEDSDYRADVFALGCVLYEMLTARRAYRRDTRAETMTAILKEDPPNPASSGALISPALERIYRRCLEKRPEERFQSARDLAFALESASDTSGSGALAAAVPAVRPALRWHAGIPLVGAGLLCGAVATWLVLSQWQPAAPKVQVPHFTRLTFDRGTIREARFTPDGQSVIYSAAWEGNPYRIFMTRTDAPESARLPVPDARLLSVSRSGEMAISLGHTYQGWIGSGTLARSSVLGSAPRVLLDRVREADWGRDGGDLAIVRRMNGLEQLEYPVGHALYQTSGYISDIRFSPSGDRIAFAAHQVFGDDAGGLAVVDREGHLTMLTEGYTSIRGVAWAPGGREIWFSAALAGGIGDGLFAVTPAGARRLVMSSPARETLFDIAPDGRALIGHERPERRVEALMQGATAPADVSIRASSMSWWISDDGASLTISDQSTPKFTAYLLKSDGSATVLGDGQVYGVSPDGRWALAVPVNGSVVSLLPTGAGQARDLPNPEHISIHSIHWLPDSRHVVMFGQAPGQPPRGWMQGLDGDPPRAFTAPLLGLNVSHLSSLPVAPDGTRVAAQNADSVPTVFRISDGSSEPVPGTSAGEAPVQWSDDGRALFVTGNDGSPEVDRVDLATGRRTRALEIPARDRIGLRISMVQMSPNGKYYVHSYSRLLTDLFVVEGLR